MAKCPGCGTEVEEGETCQHCLDTGLKVVLDAEKALEKEQEGKDEEK